MEIIRSFRPPETICVERSQFLLNVWVAVSGVGACVGAVIAVVGSVAIWLSEPQAVHQFGWTIMFGLAAISLPAIAVMAPWRPRL